MNFGAKADNLIELRRLYPGKVPAFEVIPFDTVIDRHRSVLKRINVLVDAALAGGITGAELDKRIQNVNKTLKINDSALSIYHKKVLAHGWQKVSFRTSAYAEDGKSLSFAGQYMSFVDVTYTKQKLQQYVLACFESLFSARVITYARAHRLKKIYIGGSVVVQQMFYGQTSGVMFTEDGQGNVTFAIANSWRNTTVEGRNAGVVVLPRTTLVGRGAQPYLKRIAAIGFKLEAHYGVSLDIEWAHDVNGIMLLQVRPQTTNTTNYSLTWDGTNISENYPGITLPLTYSFIKELYARVYPSFFRLMGMSQKKLQQNSHIFDNALGYIDGRVFYRIENWYELVRLIPGSRNQEFFEAMLNPAKKQTATGKSKTVVLANPRLWWLALRFAWLLTRSGWYSKQFTKKFASKHAQYQRVNWAAMTAQATLDHLQSIRAELLTLWGVPILNDVRVMIFHGIFKTVVCNHVDTEEYLNQLKGLTDRASIKPLQGLHELGKKLDRAVRRENVGDVEGLQATKSWSAVEAAAREFIAMFGGRTPDELQLENPRLGDDIWDVIRLAYASKDATLSLAARPKATLKKVALPKKLFTAFVVRNMRQALDYRERFRFNRAQVFGIARVAYLALGQKLATAKVIRHTEDIFWLTEQEISAVIRGHSWSYDLRPVIIERKSLQDVYRKKVFCLRVTGSGVVAPKNITSAMPLRHSSSPGVVGQGVAPGKITAPVVVVHTFDPALDVNNKILVARHIDPGWTLLLVQAAGVITEQGNPLSHVAIVAREISIPAIVGVRDALEIFEAGSTVTIDGTTGEVTRGS